MRVLLPSTPLNQQEPTFQPALTRPIRRRDHRREELDPVGHELAMGGLAHLADLGIEAEAIGPITRDAGGLHVGVAGADRCQRLSDPASNELVVARGLRTLAALELSFALLAVAVPGLLPGQELGEDVWLALRRATLVSLATVASLTVGAVELDPRAPMLRIRASHARCTNSQHAPRIPLHSDALAQ